MISRLAWLIVGILIVCVVASIVGCTPARVVVKTETVEVPVYIRAPLALELLREHHYDRPAPACKADDGTPRFCNGQLLDMLLGAHAALEREHIDKRAIREAQERKP